MNRHSSTYKLNDQLSLDDLRAYQAGQLSSTAHHRVERLLLENPFYADALDGLDALQQVGGGLKSQTRDLHLALQERVHESANTRRLMPLWVTSMVASVLLVLSVAVYLIFSNTQPQKQTTPALAHQIEPGTVLLDPRDLGTSEATASTSVAPLSTITSKPERLAARSGKAARNSHRTSAKRMVAKDNVIERTPSDYAPPVFIDEVPLGVHLEVPNRQVNTERAFLN